MMISPVNSGNNVSFGGIVRVKAVIHDGMITNDYKKIDSALRKFRRVLLKQADTPENTQKLDAIRKVYGILDSDYVVPTEKMAGDTRSLLTRIKSGLKYFLVSGKDAEELTSAGRDIGRTGKIFEMDFGTRHGAISQGRNEAARLDYRELKDEISLRYTLRKERPAITLYTVSNPKNKKGGVELARIGFEPKDAVQKALAQPKPQNPEPQKKLVQADFMRKLFP